jgi:hypothetical protein
MKLGDLVRFRYNNDRVVPGNWVKGIIVREKVWKSPSIYEVLSSETGEVNLVSASQDEIEIISSIITGSLG